MSLSAKRAALAAACCLMLGSVAAADLNPAGDIKAQAEKFVKVNNPEYLPAIKRVVITSYMVNFVTELKYSKSLSGLEAMIGADSDVTIKMVGSNNEQFQSITEKFYSQTVEQLKAQGVDVVVRMNSLRCPNTPNSSPPASPRYQASRMPRPARACSSAPRGCPCNSLTRRSSSPPSTPRSRSPGKTIS